jgi:hypothetical protein
MPSSPTPRRTTASWLGRVYSDVFVYAADQASKADGTRYEEDFAFVDVYSYKIDRRGNYVNVGSSYGFAATTTSRSRATPASWPPPH